MTTLVAATGAPVGSILAFGGNSSNIPDGFVLCNGALLNRNDFADLFAAIGTHWGTSSGLDFRIPTTQGLFLRGTAYGSGNDLDRASRTAVQTGGQTGDQVGSFQTDRNLSHRHTDGNHSHGGLSHRHEGGSATNNNVGPHGNLSGTYSYSFIDGGGFSYQQYTNYALGSTGNTAITTNYDGGNQSCPNNVNVNYIIKY